MGVFSYNNHGATIRFIPSPYGSGVVTRDNQNHFYINTLAGGSRQGYVKFRANNLQIGDVITVSYDGDVTGDLAINLLIINPNATESSVERRDVAVNGMYRGKTTFIVPKNGDFTIAVGGAWNTDIEGVIRNISIVINSNTFNDTTYLGIQRFTIQTTARGVFTLRGDWSTHTATITQLNDTTLRLIPDYKPPYRCQGFINLMSVANSVNYIPRIDVDVANNISIQFRDHNNDIVNLSSVLSHVYLGVLII